MQNHQDYNFKIYQDLISEIQDEEIKKIRVGLHEVYVKSRNAGISMRYDSREDSSIKNAGNLTEKTALELTKYIKSWNFTEASIGLAALNSLMEPEGEKMNAFDFIDKKLSDGDKVAVIGHFPWVDRTDKDVEVWTLERKNIKGDLPDTASEYILPKADYVLITGTTLINKTLPRLLELSQNSYNIVLGPSTPFSSVLFDYGVDAIAGSKIKEDKEVMKKVQEGVNIKDLLENDLQPLIKFKEE